jgi:hypothetical protein
MGEIAADVVVLVPRQQSEQPEEALGPLLRGRRRRDIGCVQTSINVDGHYRRGIAHLGLLQACVRMGRLSLKLKEERCMHGPAAHRPIRNSVG